MLLTLDIGNTNIKTALFDGEEMVSYWRLATSRITTSDEYGILLMDLFAHEGRRVEDVEDIIISSVVPQVNFTVEHMCRNYFKRNAMFIGPGLRTGIDIVYDNPRELGGDRIANAVAAYTIYGGPCITVDFGTATTFGAVSERGEFLGGAICPGIKLSSEALVEKASKLPRFEIARPDEVIGRNTVTNMQSGMFYGYVGQVEYLVRRIKEELGAPWAKVIATGGMAVLIEKETKALDILDGLLTLKGLRIIYERNRPEK